MHRAIDRRGPDLRKGSSMSSLVTTTHATFKSAITAGAVALTLAGAAVSTAAPAEAAAYHHGGFHHFGGGHHFGGSTALAASTAYGGFHRYGGFHPYAGFHRYGGFGHRFAYGFGRPYGAYGFHRFHRPWGYGVRRIGYYGPVFVGRPVCIGPSCPTASTPAAPADATASPRRRGPDRPLYSARTASPR